jgi:hypothetical protein
MKQEERLMDVPTKEAFEKAIADFHRADTIEKQAGELREAARATILDYWSVNMDEFTVVGEGKTMVKRINGGEKTPGVSITVPTKKGQPSRFDDSKTDDAYAELLDYDSTSAEAIFPHGPRKFAGPEAVVAYSKDNPTYARMVAGVLMKYALPATADEPMTPRVSPLK